MIALGLLLQKCVYLVSNLWLPSPVSLPNHDSFLFTIFFKGSLYIVGKLVMHPCVPLPFVVVHP